MAQQLSMKGTQPHWIHNVLCVGSQHLYRRLVVWCDAIWVVHNQQSGGGAGRRKLTDAKLSSISSVTDIVEIIVDAIGTGLCYIVKF